MTKKTAKKVLYPENLYLKKAIADKGVKVLHLAKVAGVSRKVMSEVINGHYKGVNVIPKIKAELGIN